MSSLAYVSGSTGSPPLAATSPGANRLKKLHIHTDNSSLSENDNPADTPGSACSSRHTPTPELSGLLAESYNTATQEKSEIPILIRSSKARPENVSHGADALSHVAHRSLHSDSSSEASQLASVRQEIIERHSLQPQTSDFGDSENPRPESSDYQEPPSDGTHNTPGVFL